MSDGDAGLGGIALVRVSLCVASADRVENVGAPLWARLASSSRGAFADRLRAVRPLCARLVVEAERLAAVRRNGPATLDAATVLTAPVAIAGRAFERTRYGERPRRVTIAVIAALFRGAGLVVRLLHSRAAAQAVAAVGATVAAAHRRNLFEAHEGDVGARATVEVARADSDRQLAERSGRAGIGDVAELGRGRSRWRRRCGRRRLRRRRRRRARLGRPGRTGGRRRRGQCGAGRRRSQLGRRKRWRAGGGGCLAWAAAVATASAAQDGDQDRDQHAQARVGRNLTFV